MLGEPELAGTFLREHLPADVAELLGPEPPEPVPGSFVDEELREHLSDLLYRVRLKAGCGAFAYVLMEHKSTPDRGARLQLLRYVVRILTDWRDKNGRRLPLPPHVPETEEIMGCLTQPFYDEGKAAGRAEGEAKGKASALTLVLEKSFGVLPDSVRQRIFAASVCEIDSWLLRVVNAPDLQSVFEAN